MYNVYILHEFVCLLTYSVPHGGHDNDTCLAYSRIPLFQAICMHACGEDQAVKSGSFALDLQRSHHAHTSIHIMCK